MSGAKITPAFQDYDHTRALVDGAVTVEGYDLKPTTISPPSQIFLRMLNKERGRDIAAAKLPKRIAPRAASVP